VTLTADRLKAQVLETAQKAARLGLMPGTHGNFSARDPESDLVFVTPSRLPYENLTPDDMVTVDMHGAVVDGRHDASTETAVHCRVYERRRDIHGIAHVEPRYTKGFGLVGREIPPVITTLYINVGGGVPIAPFMPSGSAEFADAVLEAMDDRFAVIWANHGLMTVGHSLPLALERAEIVEHCAASYYFALQMGEPSVLFPESLPGPLV
jgi:L-ribulose-5-phosphate 4-epimerase